MKIPMTTLVEFTTYLKDYFGYLYLGTDEEYHYYTDQRHANTPDVRTSTTGEFWLAFDKKYVQLSNTQMARMLIEFLLRNPNVKMTIVDEKEVK